MKYYKTEETTIIMGNELIPELQEKLKDKDYTWKITFNLVDNVIECKKMTKKYFSSVFYKQQKQSWLTKKYYYLKHQITWRLVHLLRIMPNRKSLNTAKVKQTGIMAITKEDSREYKEAKINPQEKKIKLLWFILHKNQ